MTAYTKVSQGFSTLVLVAAITVLVIGGGAVAYYLTDGFGQQTDDSSQTEPVESNVKSATGKDSLAMVKSALAGGDSVTCTAHYVSNSKHVVVTMYIKDKDHTLQVMRSDMGQVNTLILGQADAYTWNDAKDRGTRTSISAQELDIEGSWQNYIDNQDPDIADIDEIKCEQTDLADSLFEVPNDVTFTKAS